MKKRGKVLLFVGVLLAIILKLFLDVAGITIFFHFYFRASEITETTDLAQYGSFGTCEAWDSNETVQEYVEGFMPERIEDYFSNPIYSFKECKYHNLHEIYLEFTIEDEEQFDAYVQSATNGTELTAVPSAEGFEEYVLDERADVGSLDDGRMYIEHIRIKKILFSDETNTVIYVSIVCRGDVVWYIEEFTYFQKFSIETLMD